MYMLRWRVQINERLKNVFRYMYPRHPLLSKGVVLIVTSPAVGTFADVIRADLRELVIDAGTVAIGCRAGARAHADEDDQARARGGRRRIAGTRRLLAASRLS